ncbi:fatty acid-binding protein, liver-like [Eriocheir sinensis]|uniref:fatty acid-binding protein, liver-like n=1 Tax=Eriocheir sinensis TaxID=95602 RepID=UPI0021C9A542|nr:fatty acid-binding protein, liver-like [Eriocheir sinensis]
MSITGKYVLSGNEKYADWLSAVGIPADLAAKLEAAKPSLDVTQSGNDIVIKTTAGDKNFTNTITLGKESQATLPGGIEYTVKLTLSGTTLNGTWDFGGKTGTATVEFTADGVTQTMIYNNIASKRIYSRQ